MTHEEYVAAAEHWKNADAQGTAMGRAELLAAAEEYILANNTCALATACGEFVRCTPIEYGYRGGAFYLFSEGGEKFRALEYNKNVCLAVFDRYTGFGSLRGMQVTGTAELVEPFSPDYLAAAAFKGIPLEGLRRLPHPMNLIRIVPTRIEMLSSAFKQKGFSPRQTLVLE